MDIVTIMSRLQHLQRQHGNIRVLVNGEPIIAVEHIEQFNDPNGTVPEDNFPEYININTIG